MDITQWFMDGGQFMYLIVLAVTVSISLIIAAGASCRHSSKGIFLKVAFVFSFLPFAAGAAGYYLSYVQLMSAIVQVDPSIKQEIYNEAISVARIPLIFGGGSTVLALVAWFVSYKICKSK